MAGPIDLSGPNPYRLRDDPELLWPRIRRYAGSVAARVPARISFAGGFIPTIPGTTTYLDDL